MSNKVVFGGVLAVILLGLYVYLIGSAIAAVNCVPQPACLASFTRPMGSAMALIGGLVSALVIAELAVTKPGEVVLQRALDVRQPVEPQKRLLQILTTAYLAVWTLAGLAAFIVGLNHPDTLQSLSDLGNAWLGLAVAAGYAYFGINSR